VEETGEGAIVDGGDEWDVEGEGGDEGDNDGETSGLREKGGIGVLFMVLMNDRGWRGGGIMNGSSTTVVSMGEGVR
jgi:hypothetical protein